jgi:hypothetical protein
MKYCDGQVGAYNRTYRCGAVGKLTRIADLVTSPEFLARYPRKQPSAP